MDQYAARARIADSASYRGFQVSVRPARGIPEEVRLPATIASAFLLAVSLLVLVIAATNVGNLTLARNARASPRDRRASRARGVDRANR